MEKAITTALFIIAGVVTSVALINGVIPAVGKSTSALLVSNAAASERIRTNHEIIFAVGDSSSDTITMWVKNIGVETINRIEESDMFLILPNNSAKRVQWASSSECSSLVTGGGECWEYEIEGDSTRWSQAVTIKVTIRLQNVTSGLHRVTMTVANGVASTKEFGV